MVEGVCTRTQSGVGVFPLHRERPRVHPCARHDGTPVIAPTITGHRPPLTRAWKPSSSCSSVGRAPDPSASASSPPYCRWVGGWVGGACELT